VLLVLLLNNVIPT